VELAIAFFIILRRAKMVDIDNKRCTESVSEQGRWGCFHQHQCLRKGAVTRDGKLYCKIHDPVFKAELRKSKEAKWDAKWVGIKKIRDRQELIDGIFKGIPTETIQDKSTEIRSILFCGIPEEGKC
jgi:hypothetical protein